MACHKPYDELTVYLSYPFEQGSKITFALVGVDVLSEQRELFDSVIYKSSALSENILCRSTTLTASARTALFRTFVEESVLERQKISLRRRKN